MQLKSRLMIITGLVALAVLVSVAWITMSTLSTSPDATEVVRLYEETNVELTGPTIRSPEYWRAQLQWPQEDQDGFLVARTDDETLAGYVRSRSGLDTIEILELGVRPGDLEVGRALLSAADGYRDTCHPR